VEAKLQSSPTEQQFARAEQPHRLWELTASCTSTKLPRYHNSV